ncbi:TonB-dependent siderophore receptor, partial [Pseudomonas urmiensis]
MLPGAAQGVSNEVTLAPTQVQYQLAQADGQSRGYQARPASSTTRLGLSNRETPQAVSTVTREQLDDFKLNSVKDALR